MYIFVVLQAKKLLLDLECHYFLLFLFLMKKKFKKYNLML